LLIFFYFLKKLLNIKINIMRTITLLFCVFLLVGCERKNETPVNPTPEPEIINLSTGIESALIPYFDAGYVANIGYEDLAKTIQLTNGKPARVIKDLIGNKDLFWSKLDGSPGYDVPGPLWPTPPVYTTDEMGGYILVQNISPNLWLSKPFAAIPQPYDVYVVLRDLQGVAYESYFAVGYGLRNRGDHLEVKMDLGNGNATFQQLSAPKVLDYNKISIVRMRVDGANSKTWINNTLVPPGAVDLKDGKLTLLGYGTLSHAAQHDFYSMWVKFGTLSDTDHNTIYSRLATYYKPNTFPNKPIADNIKISWDTNTGSWKANYTYNSPNGIPEDKTKTEYQWGYHTLDGTKDLNTTSFLPGPNAKRATLKRSDFPNEIPFPAQAKCEIFVTVKVFDVNGNPWNRSFPLRSQFANDNIQ
jgi:hypothetical protein